MTIRRNPIAAKGLPALRYRVPTARPTKWAEDWRRRWFRQVGSVHQHHATGELVAFYSNERDPAARLSLQRELEGRPNGPAQVAAVCQMIAQAWDCSVTSGRLAA